MTKEKKFDFLRINSEFVIAENGIFFEGQISYPTYTQISLSDINAWLKSLNFKMCDFSGISGAPTLQGQEFPMSWKCKVVKIVNGEI